MPTLNADFSPLLSLALFAAAGLCIYWGVGFYQKSMTGLDKFAPAFLLQWVAFSVLFLWLAVAIPLFGIVGNEMIFNFLFLACLVVSALALSLWEIWKK